MPCDLTILTKQQANVLEENTGFNIHYACEPQTYGSYCSIKTRRLDELYICTTFTFFVWVSKSDDDDDDAKLEGVAAMIMMGYC